MSATAPVLDGIHHVKLPVSDLERSIDWYRTRLGYEIDVEFVEDGRRAGVAMRHRNGGPAFGLRQDVERCRAAAGFDYFAIGVPSKEALQELAQRLTALGESHAGVHFASIGWILPHLHDPDGHEIRFYTTEHHTRLDGPTRVEDPRESEATRRAAHEAAQRI